MTAIDEKQQSREYYDAIRAILARIDITPTAKIIWIYLMDKQGKNSHSWPSFETIRTDCGIGSKSTVNESISLLTEKGLLKTTTPEHPAYGKSNHYEVNITGTKTVPVQKSDRYKKCTATGTKTVLQPVRKLYPNDSVNDSVNDSYTKKPFGDFVLLTDGVHSAQTDGVNNSTPSYSPATPSKSTDITKKNITELKNIFEKARKLFPGSKRGLQTEYDNFLKKHKDWSDVLPLIEPAIRREIQHKESLRNSNQFCPQWKNFQTWINNRCWEEEFPDQNDNGECSTRELNQNEAAELLRKVGIA